MAQENNFLNKLNQQYGLPKDIAIDTIMNSKGGNIMEAGGMAICAKQFPEIPVYAGLAGAGAGILVTLLGVFIYNTLFRRRNPNVVVVNNSTTPVA